MKELGRTVSLIYDIFPLVTLLLKNLQVSYVYESAKTHGISQK